MIETILKKTLILLQSLIIAGTLNACVHISHQQVREVLEPQTTDISSETIPFYALETEEKIPRATTGSRTEIPLNTLTYFSSDTYDFINPLLPIVRKNSLTLKDKEYNVNIDILEDEKLKEMGGTYVLTFYKMNTPPTMEQPIPRTMYRMITDTQGKTLRANCQYFTRAAYNNNLEERIRPEETELVPTRIIIHQNPDHSLYGTQKDDGVVLFNINEHASYQEEWYTSKDEENPIPYTNAIKILQQERTRLHITQESCKRVLTTAQTILGNTTLDEYLRRE